MALRIGRFSCNPKRVGTESTAPAPEVKLTGGHKLRRELEALHADGTHLVTERRRQRVTAACRGFATTEVDAYFERVGLGHARGDAGVSTTQIGPRTRSVTTAPDGAALCVDYDCSVVATETARLRLHRARRH